MAIGSLFFTKSALGGDPYNYVVFVNSTGERGKVVINGVKQVGVDVDLALIFYFWGVI